MTGAGLLRVYVDGDTEPRNARVLGVSECSDLAVVEIDGEQLPMLPWSEEEGQPGAEIYVAGFPLGDPEYTLTRGVISKARDEYVTVTDDSGTITARLPAAWTQVDGTPADIGSGAPVPSIAAAPDLEGFRTTWDVPGMEFIASPDLMEFTSAELLEALAPTDCTSFERAAYDDGFFVGEYEVFNGCGGADTVFVLVAAASNDGTNGVVVAVQALTDADFAALDVILASFDVIA